MSPALFCALVEFMGPSNEGPLGTAGPGPGKSRLSGKKSTYQIEKFRNKKGSFLDQYVRDSSENLRASLRYVVNTLKGVESSRN